MINSRNLIYTNILDLTWRDLHSILDASSKEHEIDQHLYELISKDIGQRNRMKK